METFDERKTAFLQEYKALIDKYKVDWMSYPMFQPNQQGTWNIVIQTQLADTKDQDMLSPFIPQ